MCLKLILLYKKCMYINQLKWQLLYTEQSFNNFLKSDYKLFPTTFPSNNSFMTRLCHMRNGTLTENTNKYNQRYKYVYSSKCIYDVPTDSMYVNVQSTHIPAITLKLYKLNGTLMPHII